MEVLRATGLSKAFATDRWALENVDVSLRAGEAVGLVGANGSGKSTLVKLLAGILAPTRGRIESRGPCHAIAEAGSAFHRELSGRENVFFNAALLGLKRAELRRRLDEIVEFSGVGAQFDEPVREYSTGTAMRLALAVALHAGGRVLLLDETLSSTDTAFERKCWTALEEYRARGGAVVLVSHNSAHVRRACARSLLLERGTVTADGTTADILARYEASAPMATGHA